VLTWIINDTSPDRVIRFRYPELTVEHSGCLRISAVQDLRRRDIVTLVGSRHLHQDILQTLPVSQQAETHLHARILDRVTVTILQDSRKRS
jgi:hypothetical protein